MESNLLIGRLSKITMERHDADVWQKPTQYGKAIILQFKVNKNKFKKNPERYISSFIPSPSIRFPTPTSQFLLDQVITCTYTSFPQQFATSRYSSENSSSILIINECGRGCRVQL